MKDLYVEKIGSVLKQKREEKDFTIDFVSSALKINPDYIKALESGSLDILPAPVFFKGFLKNYAALLGIAPEIILKEYAEIFERPSQKQNFQEGASHVEKKKRRPRISLKYAVLLGIGLLIVFSWLRVVHVNYKMKTDLEKRKSASFKTITASKEISLHEEKKKLLGLDRNGGDAVVIKAVKDCWVEIKYKNSSIFQGLLFAGEKREFSYKKGMTIKLGNAGGVELSVKGELRKEIGKPGEVREIVID